MSAWPRPHPPGGREHVPAQRALVPAAFALVLATPVATWWLVGDLSTVPVSAGRDYAFQPWDIGPGAARAAGIGSLVLGMAMLVVLAWATRWHLFGAQWWTVLIPLLAVARRSA